MEPLRSVTDYTGKFFSAFYLFSLSSVIMPFYSSGINYLFLATGFLSIIGFFVINPINFKIFNSFYFNILIVVYLFCFLLHITPNRVSTFLYSVFFLFSFALVSPNINSYLNKEDFGKTIRIIIYFFLIVMILQQIAVLLGFPIINLNPDFSDDFLSTLSWFRINSLSSEPSYGATIIAILSIVYFNLYNYSKKEIVRFWLPAIYTFICFSSSLATALVILVILLIISGKKGYWLFVIPFISYPILLNIESENRLIKLIQELDFQNFADSFITTDLSGAFRIIPNYFFFLQANPASFSFYFGHGIDYAANYISKLMPGVEAHFNFQGGVLPFMLFDYGILTFLAFLTFLIKDIKVGKTSVFITLGIFVMINANFNTQLMWIFITFFYCSRFFIDEEKKISQANSN